MAHDVFISYSSRDQAAAEAVCQAIEAQGVRAWMAPRDIRVGDDYGAALLDAIEATRLMVVVFSSHANASEHVMREVERAVSKKRPIVPLRIENILPTRAMEYFLSASHWLDATQPPLEEHVLKLARIVRLRLTGDATLDEIAESKDREVQGLLIGTDELARGPVWSRLASRRMRRRYVLGAAVLGPAAAAAFGWRWYRDLTPPLEGNAIAVLPFQNLTTDESVSHLGTAVASELNTLLGRNPSVIVRPLDSVRRHLGKPLPEVAKALGVATVIAGNFFRSGEQLRASVDITDVARNRQLWAESFQSMAADLLSLLDRMVPKVARALHVRFDLAANEKMLGTSDRAAYDAYLRALALALEGNNKANAAGIRLFEQSVKLDPGFARAHAALAEAYAYRFYWNFSNDAALLRQAESAAREALKLDPRLPNAHNALAQALDGQGRRSEAVREYFASVRAGPNYVPGLENTGRYLFYMGELDAAVQVLDRIATVDPTRNIHIRKAMCFHFSGRPAQAREEIEQAEKLAERVDELTLTAYTWIWLRDFDAAERVLRHLERDHPAALSITEVRAWLETYRGRTAQAREHMDSITKRRLTYGIMDNIATLYAIQGERELAIEWLAKAVKAGAPLYTWYTSEFYKSVRGDPRYEAIVTALDEEYRPLRLEWKKKP